MLLFQGRDLDSTDPMYTKCTNWNTCIYLQLFQHIVNQLLMAREILIKTGSRHLSSDSCAVVCGMLTPNYFKCMLSLELAHTSGSNDHPFIWHTRSDNRKKVMGQYVLVMKNELALSSNRHMAGVFQQHSATVAMEQLMAVTGTDSKSSPLEWIPNLKKEHLHDALMEIPYDMNKKCDRRGKYISLLHVLVFAIVDKCTRNEMEPFSLKVLSETIRLKKNIGNIYLSLANPVTPLPPVVVGISFHQVASSRVHMLWGSKDAFIHSVSNARRTIHDKLSRTTQDQQSHSRGYQLHEFQDSVIKFAFSSNGIDFSVYKMMLEGGVFDSLTFKKVEQLKLICHFISTAKGHGGKNKGTADEEWKNNKKKVLLSVMEGCQSPNTKQIRHAFHRSTATKGGTKINHTSNLTRTATPDTKVHRSTAASKNGNTINSHASNSARTITPEIKRRKRSN